MQVLNCHPLSLALPGTGISYHSVFRFVALFVYALFTATAKCLAKASHQKFEELHGEKMMEIRPPAPLVLNFQYHSVSQRKLEQSSSSSNETLDSNEIKPSTGYCLVDLECL